MCPNLTRTILRSTIIFKIKYKELKKEEDLRHK